MRLPAERIGYRFAWCDVPCMLSTLGLLIAPYIASIPEVSAYLSRVVLVYN